MTNFLIIIGILAFFVWAAFAHASEKSYNELRESVDKLYNYIANEKRERDYMYGELKDRENECHELREQIEMLTHQNTENFKI